MCNAPTGDILAGAIRCAPPPPKLVVHLLSANHKTWSAAELLQRLNGWKAELCVEDHLGGLDQRTRSILESRRAWFIRKLRIAQRRSLRLGNVAICRWFVVICRLNAVRLTLVKQSQVIILREPTRHDKLVLPDIDNGMLPETGR